MAKEHDIRVTVSEATYRTWRHAVIDTGENSDAAFKIILEFYTREKGRRII